MASSGPREFMVVVTGPAAGRLRGGGIGGEDELLAPLLGHFLPMAVEQRAFDRVKQVETRFEAGALDAHEGFDRAHGGEVFERAQADLAQPGGTLGSDIAHLHCGHASDSTKACAMASRPSWSSASKRSGSGLSRSNTPTSSLPRSNGTTTSERDAASQAIWPGKACTSATRCVCRVVAAAPHTPLSSGMRMQAGRPWNGPTTSSLPSKK